MFISVLMYLQGIWIFLYASYLRFKKSSHDMQKGFFTSLPPEFSSVVFLFEALAHPHFTVLYYKNITISYNPPLLTSLSTISSARSLLFTSSVLRCHLLCRLVHCLPRSSRVDFNNVCPDSLWRCIHVYILYSFSWIDIWVAPHSEYHTSEISIYCYPIVPLPFELYSVLCVLRCLYQGNVSCRMWNISEKNICFILQELKFCNRE